ncbi:MAG: TonB-dependent receptor [Rhodocyclaceae bacterium]|nr:MAG: TonB-dependent receptor [Rhodocyclaceae bacterium]CAG0931377.1 Vitamin B12 transporter BtuB [Rhodocyclaceae bacterium]
MHFRHRAAALAIAALFHPSSPAAAAANTDEAAVIVSATRFAEADPRVPANISVVTREDIRNTPAFDLPAVLRNHAGIDVRPLYGSLGMDAAVDLRGFGETAASNTLILVDGLRLNPIDMGSISWSAVPLESIRRIEIIRGAGTVLYGDRASGGVINIVTDKSGRPRAAVTATAGSFGHRGLDAHGAAGNDTGYFNVFAHHAETGGWRRNSQQDQQTLSGRAGFYLGAGEVFVDWAAYKDSSGLPGYLRRAAWRADPRSSASPDDWQKRDGYRLRPGVKLPLTDALTLEAELSAEREDQHANYVSFGSRSDRAKDMLSFTPRLRLRHGLGGLASETVFGLDHYDGDVDARYTTAPRQTAEQTSTAVYFQNTTNLTGAWAVTLGGRSQRMEQSAHQDAYAAWFSPAMDGDATRRRNAWDLGASYSGGNWRAYGKIGTTFRFANTDELFGFSPILFVPVFAGDLRPQHGRIGEIGGSAGFGPVQARAALYRMNIKDEIGYDGALGANVNFDPTRRQGLEAELDWRIVESLKAKLAYAHVDAEFRSGPYDGRRVPLVPRDKATVQLTWDAGRAGSYAAAVNHVGSRRYSGDFNNVRGTLSGYTTLDLQAAWNLKPWTVTARLLNALDKRYAPYAGYSPWIADHYYYPADGRSFHLSARYDFK